MARCDYHLWYGWKLGKLRTESELCEEKGPHGAS